MRGPTAVLVRKEFTELLRDRRVLLIAIVMPVVIYPLLWGGMSRMEEQKEEDIQSRVLTVAMTGELEPVRRAIEEHPGLRFYTGASDSLRALVREGTVSAWLDAPDGWSTAGNDEVPTVRVVFHGPRENSQEASRRLRELLRDVRAAEQQRRYAAEGGRGTLTEVLAFATADVASESEAAGAEASRLLIYVLLMTLFSGGAAFATDMVAGEKERGTLETLFLLPVDRHTIARAKLIVVSVGTSITGVLNLLSVAFTYRMGWIGDGESMVVSASSLLSTMVLVVPLAILVGGILLAMSSYARSLKEAQYYQLPAMILVFIPAIMSMSQAIELNLGVALIPIASVAFAMRDILSGQGSPALLPVVALSTLGWAALVLWGVGRLLSREETVLGFDPEPVFARSRSGRARALHFAMALVLLAYFYLGNLVQSEWMLWGLVVSLWVLLPLLGLATLRFAWSGGHWRHVLSLRWPTPAAALAGILGGLASLLPITGGLAALQSRVLPAPTRQFEALDAMFSSVDTWKLFLVGAVSPGLWEELVFRGVCLGLLLRVGGPRAAVIFSALYFGLIHLSVFRFLPTFALGLMMAVITLRARSLVPAMLFHVTYNGSLLLGARWAEQNELPFDPQGPLAWGLSAAGWAVVAWLLRGNRRADLAS